MSEEKPSSQNRSSFFEKEKFNSIGNMYDISGDILEDKQLDALEKMELEYKVVSEDPDAISVFLKIKPKQAKEAQRNIAGTMVSLFCFFKLIFNSNAL